MQKLSFSLIKIRTKKFINFVFLTVQENVAAIFVNAKMFSETFLNLWDFL